ncbi:MAG: hypothetical protein ABR962_08840 [Candidatus Bathyarchaeia archaeon]|jgi:hypothetical protein
MVNLKKAAVLSVALLSLSLFAFSAWLPSAKAQGITYTVNQEWVKIWINTDRSIDILYNITLTYLSGQPQGIVTVGMPKSGFQIQYAQDLSGSSLQYQDSSQGSFYSVDVYLAGPVTLNQPYTFVLYCTVPEMIYTDTTNPGNVGMQLYPSTFALANNPIADLRVAIVLPQGVQNNETKYPSGLPFDNVFTEGNNTVVYWERTSWPQDQTFQSGVSFPENYVSSAPAPQTGIPPGIISIVLVALAAIALLVVFLATAKSAYTKPHISIEALGANRSLTAVEAGYVLEKEPVQVLTMILYGLLIKRFVQVTGTEPLIKLQKLQKQGGDTVQPRYYEIDYLNAITQDGTLDEKALASTYITLANNVNQKLRGYSREDTASYYKSVVDKAWAQVTQAGTPELKGDALDKNLEWLLTDDKFDDRFRGAFPPGMIIYPPLGWWWYWAGPHMPLGKPTSTLPPSTPTTAPSMPTQTKPIPAQDFANNVVKGVQTASNNIVKNVQDFANRLIPFKNPQKTPQNQSSVQGHPNCVCACHACACACACVSCACACAGGGAR